MDDHVNEKDYELLDGDRYTFFVLKKVMDRDCRLLLSDHEKLIICFTCPPYPVWIWTADDASAEDMEKAYQTARENGLFDGNNSFNLKYGLAEYFLKKDRELALRTNMFVYDCPKPIKPSFRADGHIHLCTDADLEELIGFLDLFHKEIGIDQKDLSAYREDATAHIASGTMYFWKNDTGENVACCKYGPNGDMAAINLVFTLPRYRRRHYAENLVYEVTVKAKEAGYLPMLYTDADYIASNACYEKIGYVLRGKLCTIGYR